MHSVLSYLENNDINVNFVNGNSKDNIINLSAQGTLNAVTNVAIGIESKYAGLNSLPKQFKRVEYGVSSRELSSEDLENQVRSRFYIKIDDTRINLGLKVLR